MRTRGSHLYRIYAPNNQRSQREREHFDNVWQLQSILPERLTGEQYDWIDVLWVDYSRLPSGLFVLLYTVFSKRGGYRMLFQNVTNLNDIEVPIAFLEKNLINNQKNDTNTNTK